MKTNNLILETSAKVLLFIILLFAVDIFLDGHYVTGGGFIGGLIAAGALVLLLIAYDIKTVKKFLPFDNLKVIATGLFLAAGTAAGGLFFDKPLLTHWFTDINLPVLGEISFHTAVIFDAGVFLVVVGTAMTIVQTIGGNE